MDSPGPAWNMGDTSSPVVDITVPYADESRNHLLLSAWRRQAGDLVPPPPLKLPRHSEGTYRVRIQAQQILDLRLEDQHSDAVLGGTGGPDGHLEDEIVTHFTLSGDWRFTTRHRTLGAEAGALAVRLNQQPWDFEVSRGTRALAVGLPAHLLRFPRNTLAVTAEQTSPAARLLLSQIRLLSEVAGELGPRARAAARDATVELFQGLLNDQVMDDAEFAPAIFDAAVSYIEERLLADPDLDARGVAQALHVSVRTLYRAFSEHSTSSVMTYVRERRLERARADLNARDLTISQVASRWHFSDGSHFAKAYRKRYGETPTARRRR